MGVTVNDAHVVAADIAASNGVIHGIDRVLVPPTTLGEVVPAFVEGNVIAAGSSTVFPLSDDILNRWIDEGGPATVTIDSIGSGAGFERFCVDGESDIANASRAIRESEVESCLAINREPIEIRVGTDALAVVVNSTNDFVTNLTLAELNQVFSTAVTWQDVNPDWPAEPIERFIPGTDSGTFDYFVEAVFESDEAPILAAERTSLSEDDNVLVTGVSGNPYAIGFFGFAYFQANQDVLNAVSIEAVDPNADNVNAGLYPLARPLFMYSDANIIAEKPQVGDFLSYYLTVVNEEISDVGYFPADTFGLNRAKFLVKAAIELGAM
jgi:phosphate transport system substrate-binding protein